MKRLMPARSSSTSEAQKHHPAPRSGAQGGVLSGLTAPISPVHRVHLVPRPRGHATAGSPKPMHAAAYASLVAQA